MARRSGSAGVRHTAPSVFPSKAKVPEAPTEAGRARPEAAPHYWGAASQGQPTLLPPTAPYCPLLPFTALYCPLLPFTALCRPALEDPDAQGAMRGRCAL